MITRENIELEVKKDIISFLNSDERELSLDIVSLDVISIVLKSLEYYENYDSYDTNGWQVDYWTSFSNYNLTLKVSGSMYYGYANIRKEAKNDN